MNENLLADAAGLAVISREQDGYCTVCKMDCADGLGLLTVFQVYPGIQLIYNDFEATGCCWDRNLGKDILEINHCREGREGSRLPSGSCLYLGEGDLSIHTMDNCAAGMSFPLKHYRGISVVIDLESVSQNPPGILGECGIAVADFKEKFCKDGTCFVMRAKDEIEHIFSELYSVPDCIQKPYFMLKVQELLLFLHMVDVKKEKQREFYTSPQVETVRKIHKRLISNLQERPTIEELSKEYLINTAALKDTFKGVYGQPIGAYMKTYRIKQAALLLRQTQATIAEIAGQVGYENQSKFAAAFRDEFKIAPTEYRKQNSGDRKTAIPAPLPAYRHAPRYSHGTPPESFPHLPAGRCPSHTR
ncbi:MAG: AraC family transcriptional regulator [Eubacteriales bacterium]|nr:AraC family transcriptional regulator [Eubacteriales bacterium]